MQSLKFPPWDLRDLISDYLSRQIESESGRVSRLAGILIVTGISLALWVMIAVLVTRFF